MENPTSEQIQKHIKNAEDSITVIDELSAKDSLTADEQAELDRNKEHIRTMLGKSWFDGGLTKTKRTKLTTKSAV